MTKLELANELIKQLQEQNSSNLDMIDKLQQQVQVQQAWFQWAAGIFITIAIAIGGLTWLSIRAERKRSREELINLKRELGIDNLVQTVNEQMEKLKQIKEYTDEWEETMNFQAFSEFVYTMVDIRTVKTNSEVNVIKALTKLMGLLKRPVEEDMPTNVMDSFIEGLLIFWEHFKKEDTKIVGPAIEMFCGVIEKLSILYSPMMSEEMIAKYEVMCRESTDMLEELK